MLKKKLLQSWDWKKSKFEIYGVFKHSVFPIGFIIKIKDKDGTEYEKRFKNEIELAEFLKSLFLA